MLDDHTFGVQDPDSESRLSRWYRNQRPALIATAWFWLLFLLLALVALFTGWASLPLTLALQALVSFGAGFLAAWLYHHQNPQGENYARLGAYAGLYLPLTSAAVLLVVGAWLGISSFGALLPLMLPYFLSLPVALVACTLLAALGGRSYKLFTKRQTPQ